MTKAARLGTAGPRAPSAHWAGKAGGSGGEAPTAVNRNGSFVLEAGGVTGVHFPSPGETGLGWTRAVALGIEEMAREKAQAHSTLQLGST